MAREMTDAWLWLFPATYLVHLAEEAWAGERFYRWIARIAGRPMHAATWVFLNIIFFAAMTLAVAGVRAGSAPAWLVPGLGTIVVINALAHLIAGRVTHTYSPGLYSGLLLWLPLGSAALIVSARSLTTASWLQGVGAGVLAHGVVALLAITATRGSTP